jgi:hypothetical protein
MLSTAIYVTFQGLLVLAVLAALAFVAFMSVHLIGSDEIGLVNKRFSFRKLPGDDPIAFRGEAGYQAALLMPGWRWKTWPIFSIDVHPWVQVPAGQIGLVIAQVGAPLPVGAKSAVYKSEFGNFVALRTFVDRGGQKGVQRQVLPPGTLAPIHPVAFLVLTAASAFGVPLDESVRADPAAALMRAYGLTPEQMKVVRIQPRVEEGHTLDVLGVVTTYEGDPLPKGDIACRLDGFDDIEKYERDHAVAYSPSEAIEIVLGSKNQLHNNYQDFQTFLDKGGKIGLQHDPLLYGAYNLNPVLVHVELVPMLVVQQGQVAVVKSYVGLPTQDVSGLDFKFGSLVRPGHRGIWQEPLRTGKYPLNPRIYQAEIVPTSILTLNWADATSQAHQLDRGLNQIEAKSREGFIFMIDLQVQIHVPDTLAPQVISIVGTMLNLVNEVLQAAVGNHFRDKLQSMAAITFIQTRQQVQEEAMEHIKEKLADYRVEVRGVYIQDVILPQQLVQVLTDREVANQQVETLKMQESANKQRIETEKAAGLGDAQRELAKSEVGVKIKENNALARKAEADGEATFTEKTGAARGAEVRAVGLARAEAYDRQVQALGPTATALVNVIDALSRISQPIVPEVLVSGGSSLDALAGTLVKNVLGGQAATSAEPSVRKDTLPKV